jgi:NAD(P)-dependent dehydrogenase (short-subunit alcohol dehydrogenase family)
MKTALVTGATRRLGSELARSFARDGYRVIVHANASFEEAKNLSDDLNSQGYAALAMGCDLSSGAAVTPFFQQVIAATGVPDVIVNNASVFKYDSPGSVDPEILQASLQLHVVAPILMTELAVRNKRPDQSLAIFNMLDQKLLNLNPDYFSYTVGKAGLHAATRLWHGMKTPGVRVFGILPGLLFPSGGQTAERYAEDVRKSPLQKPVTSRDIYAAIDFFVRNEEIGGQDFAVDGGESLTARMRDVAFE